MLANRLTRWLCGISLIAITVLVVSTAAYAECRTATGARPEVQSKRTVDTQTKLISNFDICADLSQGGRCAEIAAILQERIESLHGAYLDVVDLAEVDKNENQIVLGVISNPIIANLAYQHKQNAVDLGGEGYNFISLPNPYSTNGSWRILIFGSNSKGVFRGAFTLLDLIADDGGGQKIIGNFRIRDYPDRPYRAIMHWLPVFSGDKGNWMEARKVYFKELAAAGCCAILIGSRDVWRMSDDYNGYARGTWLNETAYWARYYGMEPIPEVHPCPYYFANEHPLWREGEWVEEEPFIVVPDGQGGYILESAIDPFSNEDNNLDFETDDDGNGWPDDWTQPSNFIYGEDESGHYVEFNNSNWFYLSRIWDDPSLLQPGSFYVLEGIFKDVVSVTSGGTVYAPWLMVRADDKWGQQHLLFHDRIPDGNGFFIKDFYFWTPPLDAEHAPTGYSGLYYEDIEGIRIMVYMVLNAPSDVKIRIDNFFLERRESSLRNVMLADAAAYNGFTYPGLELTVTSLDGQPYTRDVDYILNWIEPPSYRMRTHKYDVGADYWQFLEEYISSITWLNEDAIDDTMLVSYTAGVPADWVSSGQKTRFCYSNGEMYQELERVLGDLYKEFEVGVGNGSYALNPKYIDIRLDEIRGTNRCGRCEALGRTNAEHLIEYIKTFQQILNNLVAAGYEKAAETSLLVASDMLNPYHNGGNAAYQFGFGGPWGESSGGLDGLDGTDVELIMQLPRHYGPTARANGWPASELAPGQSNVFVVAGMPGHPYPPWDVPEYYVTNDTWYEDDCLGFTSYHYDEVHTEEEIRLLNYGWKRYRHPDATMHAYQNGFFVTDDVGGHTVEVEENELLSFAPFGHPEVRDPTEIVWMTTAATIDWGSGSPQNVLSILNKGLVNRRFSSGRTYNVTLTVEARPPGGGAPVTQTAVIKVKAPQKIPIIKFSSLARGEAVPFGLRSVAPNPFNPTTRIQFGLSRPGAVQLAIYDVEGRRVRMLLDNETLPAGVHTVFWDGTNAHGSGVACGIYFVRLVGENQIQTRKVVLIR